MKRDEFGRNLAAGTYDLIVLDILHDGPSYGYGIRKRIFARSKGTLNWQDGTIYPVLRHLEEQGFVTSRWKGPKEGRQRCYYRLTPRGHRAWQKQRHQWNAFTRAVNALLNLPAHHLAARYRNARWDSGPTARCQTRRKLPQAVSDRVEA